MSKQTIQEAAEKWAVDNCPSCNDRRYQGACVCRYLENAFLAGSSHSMEDLVKRLEEANPYKGMGHEPGNVDGTWKECVETLRSIINEQSVTNKEGI